MHAGIVGSGVMGKVLALTLIKAGWKVTIFDKNSHQNCSMAAAGLLTPIAELEKSEFIISKLGHESLHDLWEGIIANLNQDIYFKKLGSLVVAHKQDYDEFKQFYRLIKNKITFPQDCHTLQSKQITELEPDLNAFSEMYFLPKEGQIDNQHVLSALDDYLQRNARVVYENAVLDKYHHFDYTFDCRGLGAKSYFDTLRAIRGELIWLHAPHINIKRPVRLLHPRYRLYLVPRPQNVYIIGASEIESEDMSAISVRTTLELLSALYYIHPGFCEANVIKTVTHCRPAFNNNLPKIHYNSHVISINGLYRHGFLIAPAIARDVIRFLENTISSVHYPELWEPLNDTYLH